MARSGRVRNKAGSGETLQGSPEVEIPNVKRHLPSGYSRPRGHPSKAERKGHDFLGREGGLTDSELFSVFASFSSVLAGKVNVHPRPFE